MHSKLLTTTEMNPNDLIFYNKIVSMVSEYSKEQDS